MAGSILTFVLFDAAARTAAVRGEIEGLGDAPHLFARDAGRAVLAEQRWPTGQEQPFAAVLGALLAFADAHLGRDGLGAVGHRVVHGGADHLAPERVTAALDGLVMATRCGSLDPGVILYLGQQGHSFTDIENMLYRQSGLLGVSGLSGDVRVLLGSADPHAKEALELFSYRIATQAGALASALGGLDGLVFTAGVGEHAAPVRAAACARLAWLGVRLDEAANSAGAGLISTPGSVVEVRVIATDEEAMIARHTRSTIAKAAAGQDAA